MEYPNGNRVTRVTTAMAGSMNRVGQPLCQGSARILGRTAAVLMSGFPLSR